MAIFPEPPTNFRCDKTTARVGDTLTFTWEASATPVSELDWYHVEVIYKDSPESETLDGTDIMEPKTGTMSCSVVVKSRWVSYSNVLKFYALVVRNDNYERAISNYITINILPGTSETPAPTVSGRLEQFQNSAGEQIFPRTIIEGIFRQSDNKPLADILAGISVGDIDLSLYAPKASPVFTGSISMGRKAGTAIGESSFAVGSDAEASGINSHAEGIECVASGKHAHAEGGGCIASASCDHAEGAMCTASGSYSHAEGLYTTASGKASHAAGFQTIAAAAAQTVIGENNVVYDSMAFEYTNPDAWFIVGNGENESARSNAFRVASGGVYAYGSYNTSGADYAEMFEWADGNPDKQDRAGLFVTLEGAKIRLAGPGDDYILGIVSGNPSVVGDVHDDQWQGMYLHDVFGRPIWENAEGSNHTERHQKLNPNYDNTQKYTPRSRRPEWDSVGMLGKLVAVDDGTCVVNGWCTVGEGGVATASENRMKYRVMERLNENHIRVMIL